MNQNVADALERIEEAIHRATDAGSKQPRFGSVDRRRLFSSVYGWAKDTLGNEPAYAVDSRARDRWLSTVWRQEPHLAGVVNGVTVIDKNRNWNLVGGRNQVARFNNILRFVENGAGWRMYASKTALAYYTHDIGAITEIGRDGPDGPVRSLYTVDPARCYLTGNPGAPLSYTPAQGGKEQNWTDGDFFRVCSLPSTDESLNDLGYCAISRSIQLARLMVAVYEHDQESLGAKAPKGLLLLQNITEDQWDQAMKKRAADLTAKGRNYFGGVHVLASEGIEDIDAKLIALSQLPAGFDLETFTNLLLYGYALAFGYDYTEFWPAAGGGLGRGTETTIQHQKATGKGGLDFILNYQDRLQQNLPEAILFEFEQRDIDGELQSAALTQAWAQAAQTLLGQGVGALTVEEGRILLAQQGIIPPDWTEAEEEATASADGQQRSIKAIRAQVERAQMIRRGNVWAAAFTYPFEPIVRMDQDGAERVLWRAGIDFLEEQKAGPMARSMAEQYGHINPRMARAILGQSFAVATLPALPVSRADDTLYTDEGEDFTITVEDVTQAIQEGAQRVGKKYGQLLNAKDDE